MLLSTSGTDTPLFSIVLPVYNQEKWLRPALDSVLSQSYEGDYEVIAVDDGSTDSSPAICDEYAARYPERVRVIHQPNRGTLQARTAGYAAARGRYMVSVDPDDLVSPDLLSEAARVIEEKGADLVVFNFERIDTSGKVIERPPAPFPEGYVERETYFRQWIADRGGLNALWSKVFLKELYNFEYFGKGVRLFYPGEDRYQSVDIVANARSIYYLDKVLYYYRDNPAGSCNTFRMGMIIPEEQKESNLYLWKRARELGYYSEEDEKAERERLEAAYPGTVWSAVAVVIKHPGSFREKKDTLGKIRDNEYIREAEARVYSCPIPSYKKLGLRLFYARLFSLVIAYESSIYFVKRLLQRLTARETTLT